jgi:nitroreductase
MKNRSYRRFDESYEVSMETLRNMIHTVRNVSSAANLQPLRYILCNNRIINEKIFKSLHWARYIENGTPPDGERPSAYIIILGDKETSRYHQVDAGISMQTILLGLTEVGLGGCMFGAADREVISDIFKIDGEKFDILYLIAVGKPKQDVQI